MNKLRTIYLYIYFILIFIFLVNIFQLTPLEKISYVVQAIIIIISIYYSSFIIINNGYKINKHVLYLIFINIYNFIYGAIVAYFNYNQPLLFGLLAGRNYLLIIVLLLLFYKIHDTRISNIIFKILILLSFIQLIIIIIGNLFIENIIRNITPQYFDKIILISEIRAPRLKINSYFVEIGFILCLIKLTEGNNKSIVYYLLFIIYLILIFIIIQGRLYIIFNMIIFIYIIKNYGTPRKKIILYIIIIIIMFIALYYYRYKINSLIELYFNIFKIFRKNDVFETSMTIRMETLNIMVEEIKKNPIIILFGIGKVSNQWRDGLKGIFYGYFYPEDLGILGAIFTHGLINVCTQFVINIIIVIKVFKKIIMKENTRIIVYKIFLLYNILSFVLGNFLFSPIGYLIPLILLIKEKEIQLDRISE